MRGLWASWPPRCIVRSRVRGWKQTKWKKKRGGGREGEKNSIFVKRGKRPRGEFLLGILELEKKNTHKKKTKKKKIIF